MHLIAKIFPVVAAVLIGLPAVAGSEEPAAGEEMVLDLMRIPPVIHYLPFEGTGAEDDPFADRGASPEPTAAPTIPNAISDYLPGTLHDVSVVFERQGIAFGPDSLAWFSPEESLLLVRNTPKNIELIEAYHHAMMYDPVINLVLAGELSSSAVASASKDSAPGEQGSAAARWQITTRSGLKSVVAASGSKGIGYECEMEGVIGPDGYHVDLRVALKAVHEGREYKLDTSATTQMGKPLEALLVAADGSGAEFRLSITPTKQVLDNHYSEPIKDKEEILAKIERHLSGKGVGLKKGAKNSSDSFSEPSSE